jgi:WD40 repeat protein
MAKATLSFDAWKPGAVRPAAVDVEVRVSEMVKSPELKATLKGYEGPVRQVAWTPDGKTLATLANAVEGKLWDVAERKERAIMRSDLGDSYGMACTPDGKSLAIGHYKNDVKVGPTGGITLWDVATVRCRRLLQHAPPRAVTGLVVAPDGGTIAAVEQWKEGEKSAYNNCVTLWDVASGQASASLATDPPTALAISPDGRVLAWSSYAIEDTQVAAIVVYRRDLTSQRDLSTLPNSVTKNPLNCLAFSPDSRTLAGADYEGNIILWDTASSQVRSSLRPENGRRVRSLAFSPDGEVLAAGIGDRPGRGREAGLIVLRDANTVQRRLTLRGHTHEVLSVAFSPDAKQLASGGADRTVRLWEIPARGEASEVGGGS